MKTLLIDDIRNIKADIVAKTYKEGIEALKKDIFDVLYLDHDLGEEYIDEQGFPTNGYGIMCFLEANTDRLPKKIIVVTSNPVGRQRIQQLINKLYEE